MPDRSTAKSQSCPKPILDLIVRFDLHRDTYQRETYNETQVRREFIDPFFKALGWDVDNEQGHAEAYKNVIHEDAIKVGGSTKAPDYCFRIGGVRKYFVEAKKPSDQTAIQRHIDATDRQIDQLVYELYGLTDDEIRIVEETTRVRL